MCLLLIAVDMAGGAAKGIVGRRVRRVGGGCSGPDQAFRAAAADHTAVHCKCHQRGRGSYSTTQVHSLLICPFLSCLPLQQLFLVLSCFGVDTSLIPLSWESHYCESSFEILHTPMSCTSEV